MLNFTLFRENNNLEYDSMECYYVDVKRIIVNPNQPRQYFNDDALDELKQSIKQYGIIQPLSVRKTKGFEYELIAGERRLRAAMSLGLQKVPVVIVNMNEKDSAVVSLIENIQREDLNFMEEAEAYQKLIEKFDFTQEQLSKQVGKSQSCIANKLRVLKLSPTVKKVINDNNLTERHARAILKIDDEFAQLTLLKDICDNKLNVRESEDLIHEFINGTNKESSENISMSDNSDESIEGKSLESKSSSNYKAKQNNKIKVLRKVRDYRIFENTIKQAIGFMKKSGIEATYKVVQGKDSVDFVIKIPTVE